MSGDIETAVHGHLLSPDHHLHEECYAVLDQVVDLRISLRDINGEQRHAMAESFSNYEYNYVRGMMIVYFPPTINPKVATYARAEHILNGMALLKGGFGTVMLNGRHRHGSVKVIEGEDTVNWAADPLCVRCVL